MFAAPDARGVAQLAGDARAGRRGRAGRAPDRIGRAPDRTGRAPDRTGQPRAGQTRGRRRARRPARLRLAVEVQLAALRTERAAAH